MTDQIDFKKEFFCPSCGSYANHKEMVILGAWVGPTFGAFKCETCSSLFTVLKDTRKEVSS